jgi:Na+:H+ antiporter
LDTVILAFLVAAMTIVLGFLGEEFFNKTGIPDPILMLLLGLLLGPIFHVLNREDLIPITPFFAALALIIILFDAGLNMKVQEAIRSSSRAIVLAVVGWTLNVVVTAGLCKVLFGWRLLNGLLLGAMVGGSSSVIVVALSRKVNMSKRVETILSLESVLTDVLCTVGAFAIIDITLSGETNLQSALTTVGTAFGVGILLGSILGIAWLMILERMQRKSNAYMLTLAMLFLTFVAARSLGGTGALSALFLGLVIGNAPSVARVLKFKTTISIDEKVRAFHNQISFLIRSFFFVFTGLLFSFTSIYLSLFGVLLSIVFLGVRMVAVKASMIKSQAKNERTLMTVMLPRGLAAAVLASIPLTVGISNSQAFPEVVFIVILATILICTAGTVLLNRNEKKVSAEQSPVAKGA